jgi:lysozyme
MDNALLATLQEQLLRHEGLKLKPYRCPAGKLTIGVGRNLDDCGISRDEALTLLENDIHRCETEIQAHIPTLFSLLSPNRKTVLVNMAFNLGTAGMLGFRNMLAHALEGNFEKAANDMLASKWAKQVGKRAIELSELMRKG